MREVNMQPLQIRCMTMEQSLNNQSGNNLTQKLFQKVRFAPNARLKMYPRARGGVHRVQVTKLLQN